MLTNLICGLFTNFTNIIYLVIGALFVLGLVYITIKFPNGKHYALGFLTIILIISGIFTAFANYEWITARGGIYGAIEDIKNVNKVTQNELTFDFEKFTLEATGNKDEYMARMAINYVNDLDSTKKAIYVNSEPTTLVTKSKKYIIANYSYLFENDDLQEMGVDTLKIRFSFSEKLSECIISTSGGIKNVKFWNEYIEKNGFKVEIKDLDYMPNLEIIGKQNNLKLIFNASEDLEKGAFGVAKLTRTAGDQERTWQFSITANKTYTLNGLSLYGDYKIEFITTSEIKSIETITFNFSEDEPTKTIIISIEKAPLTQLTLRAGGESGIQFTKITKDDNTFRYKTDLLKLTTYGKEYLDSVISRMTPLEDSDLYYSTQEQCSISINYYNNKNYVATSETCTVVDFGSLGELYGFPAGTKTYLFVFPSVSTTSASFAYCPEANEICIFLTDKPSSTTHLALANTGFEKGETSLSIELVLK